jgi:hypothetical protein
MTDKRNVILADCEPDEVKTLQGGLNDSKAWNFITESYISNGSHSGGRLSENYSVANILNI